MKIVVVGAGLSGLAAALHMQQAGHEVIVLESNNYPGGRCKMFQRDGFTVDTCPELAATSYRYWLNLVRDAGLEDELYYCPSRISIPRDGRLVEIDLSKPLRMMATPLVSLKAKLNFVHGAFKLRKQIRAVPPNLLDGIALDDPELNAGQMALEAFGQEATDYLLDPMLRPFVGTVMSKSSTLLLPYTLAEWTQMVTLKGGLQRLPIAVAAKLDVRYQTTVQQIHSHTDKVTLDIQGEQGSSATLSADRCLITAQYDDAERIYPRLKDIGGDYGRKMEYLHILDVKLAYSKAPKTGATMVMFPYKENRDINVISLAHNKCPDRAPAGHSLFSLFTEHLEYDRMAAMPDEQVIELVQPQVEALFPEVKGHLLFTYVSRQPRTSLVPDPGFFRRTAKLWEDFGRESRVHLGGDVFNFGSMEAAVGSGVRAAERLIQV